MITVNLERFAIWMIAVVVLCLIGSLLDAICDTRPPSDNPIARLMHYAFLNLMGMAQLIFYLWVTGNDCF